MKSSFCRIIKNSTFLVTKWTLSSSECANTAVAYDASQIPLVSLGVGHPSPFLLPLAFSVPRTHYHLWHLEQSQHHLGSSD